MASPISNPLAPASYRAPSEPDEKPLSNLDFKKLLMTPRAGGPPSSFGRTPSRNSAPSDGPSSNPIRPVKQQKAKKEGEERKPKKWHTKKEKDGELPKYRDRAKERRDDANPDYVDTDPSIGGFHAVPPPEVAQGKATHEIQKKIIANSKFLGGDMEHTHLVKGLDFALLNKVRSEMKQKSEEDGEKKEVEKEAQLLEAQRTQAAETNKGNTLSLALGLTKKEKATTAVKETPTTVPYNTPLGKSVTLRLLEKPKHRGTEHFLPGRMAFVFDIDEEFPQELPTTLIRSKEDCPAEVNPLTSRVDPVLLEKMSKLMGFMRQGSKQKRRKRVKEEEESSSVATKEKENGVPTPVKAEPAKVAPAPKPLIVEEEDELFPDAGDYVLDVPKKKDTAKSESTDSKSRQSYFQKPEEEEGEKKEEPASGSSKFSTKAALAQAQAYAQLNKLGALDAAATTDKKQPDAAEAKKKKAIDEKKDPNFVDDSYSECYPASFEAASYAFEESDDEEDLSKMDLGTKRNKLKRWDFEDEEQWNAYNDQREAMPKAAFQFGVKMADGRKTRRTPKDKDQKLDADLNKINLILKKRAEDTVAARRGKGGGGAADLIADLVPGAEEGEIVENRRSRRRHLQVDGDDRNAKRHK